MCTSRGKRIITAQAKQLAPTLPSLYSPVSFIVDDVERDQDTTDALIKGLGPTFNVTRTTQAVVFNPTPTVCKKLPKADRDVILREWMKVVPPVPKYDALMQQMQDIVGNDTKVQRKQRESGQGTVGDCGLWLAAVGWFPSSPCSHIDRRFDPYPRGALFFKLWKGWSLCENADRHVGREARRPDAGAQQACRNLPSWYEAAGESSLSYAPSRFRRFRNF